MEFRNVKDKIAQIVQDVKALAVMDELSDDEVFEISTMMPHPNAHRESVSRSTLCMPATQLPPQIPSPQSRRVSLVSWQRIQCIGNCAFVWHCRCQWEQQACYLAS